MGDDKMFSDYLDDLPADALYSEPAFQSTSYTPQSLLYNMDKLDKAHKGATANKVLMVFNLPKGHHPGRKIDYNSLELFGDEYKDEEEVLFPPLTFAKKVKFEVARLWGKPPECGPGRDGQGHDEEKNGWVKFTHVATFDILPEPTENGIHKKMLLERLALTTAMAHNP